MTVLIEYEIIGEGFQISTNQKQENGAFSLLIGQNLRPFPDNFVLYNYRLLIADLINGIFCLINHICEINLCDIYESN